MRFLISFLFIVFSVASNAQAQTCAQYFGYYSLSAKELRGLQELAQLEINTRSIQKPAERSPILLEIEGLKKTFRDRGISNSVYERVLREVYHSFVVDGYFERGRSHEREQILFRQRAELEEARVQEEEVDRILEKYGARTLSEAMSKATVSGSKENMAEILEKPYLLKRLDLKPQDMFGSVLHVAAEYGTPQSIKNIVALGLDVNVRDSMFNRTPLDVAFENKDNFFTLVELGGHSYDINDLLSKALSSLNTPHEVALYLIKNATDVNIYVYEPALYSWILARESRAANLGYNDISLQDASVLKAILEKEANSANPTFSKESSLDHAKMPTTKAILKEAIVKWKAEHGGTTP